MKRILGIVVALALIGGAIGLYLYNKPVQSLANKKPAYSLPAGELLSAFQSDEAKANKEYLGKVIAVTGTIQEIAPGEDMQMQVILDAGDLMSRVSCVMEEPYEQFLKRGLKKGDTVQIKGECTGMAMDVVLDRCVMVE